MLERRSILTALIATLPAEVVADIAALETIAAAVPGLQAETTALRERVAALEARLGQDSTNRSRPPSSDRPGRRSRANAPAGQRSAGGQRGRHGAFRQRHPPAAVTHVQVGAPAACDACGQGWPEAAAPRDRIVQRHQVTELPCPTAIVTAYQVVARCCGACGSVTRGQLPADAPRGAFGPVLLATLRVLTGRSRLSKREAADLLATLYGVQIAVGSVSAAEAIMSQALVDGGEASRPVGERLVALTGEVFAWWHQYRAGEVDRPALDAGLGRVAAELAAVLAVGRDRGQPGAVQRCCREYTAVWPAV